MQQHVMMCKVLVEKSAKFRNKFTRTNMPTYSILESVWHPKSTQNRIRPPKMLPCMHDTQKRLPKWIQDGRKVLPRCSQGIQHAPIIVPRCYQAAAKMLPHCPTCPKIDPRCSRRSRGGAEEEDAFQESHAKVCNLIPSHQKTVAK